jgi:probable F420-dependent oxidoreductase
MRVGLFLASASPIATPDYLAAYAHAADDSGFSSVWVGEHVVLFDDHVSPYPYSADGKIGLPPESGLLDQFATLSFLAAETSRVRLGTAICLLPQRNPVATAKEAATVDWLSGGRFDFGIGIGWLREEFEALAMPFEDRAARTHDFIGVMRSCWQDDVSSYDGAYYTLPACRMYPKPIQQPHPPLYFGGESTGALARVADFGGGWHGFNVVPKTAPGLVARLEALLADRGRKLADVDVTVSPYLQPVTPADLPGYRDAGVDQIVLCPFAFDAGGIADLLGNLSDQFVGPAAALG